MNAKIKKELREWIILITIGGFIYFMGWHKIIASKIQQGVLASGVIQPKELKETRPASYDFVLEDIYGEFIEFDTFKDQIVFINFWATWCPPCIAEMPDIHDLYENAKGDVAFVMISLDQDKEKARDFIAQRGFDFPVYFLGSGLPPSYDTRAIPTTYLIDKEGQIRVENSGMAKYNTTSFKELLADLK